MLESLFTVHLDKPVSGVTVCAFMYSSGSKLTIRSYFNTFRTTHRIVISAMLLFYYIPPKYHIGPNGEQISVAVCPDGRQRYS